MSEIDEVVGAQSAEQVQSIVNCAVAVGYADGGFDGGERRELSDALMTLLSGHREWVQGYIQNALQTAQTSSADEIYEEAAGQLDEDGCEACVVVAAAIISKSGGIGASEGVALQALSNALGIEAGSQHYMKLLGQGMTMARS